LLNALSLQISFSTSMPVLLLSSFPFYSLLLMLYMLCNFHIPYIIITKPLILQIFLVCTNVKVFILTTINVVAVYFLWPMIVKPLICITITFCCNKKNVWNTIFNVLFATQSSYWAHSCKSPHIYTSHFVFGCSHSQTIETQVKVRTLLVLVCICLEP